MKAGYFIYQVCLLAIFAMCIASSAYAQIPREISYQGFVLGPGNQPIADGQHTVDIRFYDAAIGGLAIYTERQTIETIGGVFTMIIGTVTPIPASLSFDRQYWLGLSIDNAPEMAPRTAFTSAPYALNAASADVARSVSSDAVGVVTSVNEIDGPVRIINSDSTIRIEQTGNVITLSMNCPPLENLSFADILSGMNRGQLLEVGDSSTLKPVAGGIIESNRMSGATVSVDANSSSYAGRVKIPAGAATLQVRLTPAVGCTPNSSVTVSQFDQSGNEFLVGTMVTDIGTDTFTVRFSAEYPTATGFLTYLIVNP